MRSSDLTEIRSIVTASCEHVLPQCGIAIEETLAENSVDLNVNAKYIAAFIGFSADRIRGTLTLIAPLALVRQSYPLPLAEEGTWELDVFDWAGEIANRLLGRVKMSFANRGIDVAPSTPKVMFAEQLHMTQSRKNAICNARFRVHGSTVCVAFDALCSEGPALFDGRVVPEDDAASNQDVLLF